MLRERLNYLDTGLNLRVCDLPSGCVAEIIYEDVKTLVFIFTSAGRKYMVSFDRAYPNGDCYFWTEVDSVRLPVLRILQPGDILEVV